MDCATRYPIKPSGSDVYSGRLHFRFLLHCDQPVLAPFRQRPRTFPRAYSISGGEGSQGACTPMGSSPPPVYSHRSDGYLSLPKFQDLAEMVWNGCGRDPGTMKPVQVDTLNIRVSKRTLSMEHIIFKLVGQGKAEMRRESIFGGGRRGSQRLPWDVFKRSLVMDN